MFAQWSSGDLAFMKLLRLAHHQPGDLRIGWAVRQEAQDAKYDPAVRDACNQTRFVSRTGKITGAKHCPQILLTNQFTFDLVTSG
jgi:hypothetical protein